MLVDVAITIYSMHFFFYKRKYWGEREPETETETESFTIKLIFLILNPLKFKIKDAKNSGHSHKTIACH